MRTSSGAVMHSTGSLGVVGVVHFPMVNCFATSDQKFTRLEHVIGKGLVLAYGRHALKLEDLLLTMDLNLLRATHLRLVLGFEFVDAILKTLHVRVLIY